MIIKVLVYDSEFQEERELVREELRWDNEELDDIDTVLEDFSRLMVDLGLAEEDDVEA